MNVFTIAEYVTKQNVIPAALPNNTTVAVIQLVTSKMKQVANTPGMIL